MNIDMLLSCIVWLFSGFINGITSFGGNIVAIPILSLFIDPHKAVPIACISIISTALVTIIIYRHSVPLKEFFIACVGCFIGAPLGIPVLTSISQKSLLVIISLVIFIFLLYHLIFQKILNFNFIIPKYMLLPFSILFGFLYTLTGIPGPIMAIYVLLRKWKKEEILIMMNGLGFLGGIFASIQHYNNGLLNDDVFMSISGAVFAAIGVLLSIPFAKKLNAAQFRKGVMWMLAFSATILAIRATMC